MAESLKYETVIVKDLIEGIPSRYTIPHFQRRISWGAKAQQELIASIHRGFPIGSLLVHLLETTPSGSKYSIIDGLQRTNSIRRFQENQGSFVSEETIKESWIGKFKVLIFKTFKEEIAAEDAREFLVNYMSGIRDFSDMQLTTFYKALRDRFPVTIDDLMSHDTVEHDSKELLSAIKGGMDISLVQLPVIVYQGDRSLLPEIFEKLNSNVVKLNKYQIVAAVWQDQCKIDDHAVRDQVRSYWRERLDELNGLVVENVDPNGEPDELYLFDYLIGLSRAMCKDYPLLFDDSWNEQIAFQVATVAHGLRIADMTDLESKFLTTQVVRENGSIATVLNTDPFTNAVTASCQLLDSVLKSRLSIRLNDTEHDKFPGHTVFQISATLTRILIEFFDPVDWSERRVVAQGFTPTEKKSIQRSYLQDRLRKFWQNSGDSKFSNRVWIYDDEGGITGSPPLFAEESSDAFATTLNGWFDTEMQRRDRVRVVFNSETRLVLKYFYSSKVSILADNEQYFHLDHLVPVDWWKTFLAKLGPNYGAPFNAIGNLCLMTSSDNLTKGSKLPIPWFEERSTSFGESDPAGRDRFLERCNGWYFLVDRSLFAYPLEEGDLSGVGLNDVEAFVLVSRYLEDQSKERWRVIVDQLISELF